MEKIADQQIEKALELHKAEGKILRILQKLEDPEQRFQTLMAAGLLTGISLSQLSGWMAAGTATASATKTGGR